MEGALTVAGWTITLGTALLILWRPTKAIALLVKRLDRTIETVEREFTPNGGQSIKDAVERIDRRVWNLEQFRTVEELERNTRWAQTDEWRKGVSERLELVEGEVYDPPNGTPV